MTGRPIIVFDSGAGGLPYLDAIRALLPGERFVYLADRAGFPYGTKTRDEVERLVLDRLGRIIARMDPKLVVIACNTASQAALEAVRRTHPECPVVGTVPAVKPAAERTHTGVIAVLATKGATEDPYLGSLIDRFAKGVRVLRVGAQDLVTFVERRLFVADEAERLAVCRDAVSGAVREGADQIVLACTHFLHVARDIARVAGSGVTIVDSRDGVARRAAALVETAPRADADEDEGEPVRATGGEYFVTGAPPFEPSHALFAERFGLEFAGSLDDPT